MFGSLEELVLGISGGLIQGFIVIRRVNISVRFTGGVRVK